MTVAAVGAGDVVVGAERFANSHGHGFFAFVEMSEAGHKGAQVEIVGVLLEFADGIHAAIHAQPLFVAERGVCFDSLRNGVHRDTPDILASASNMTAKSS